MTTTGTLDALLVEERVFRPAPATVIAANVKPGELAEAYRLAEADHAAYWEQAALALEKQKEADRELQQRLAELNASRALCRVVLSLASEGRAGQFRCKQHFSS